MKRWEIINDTPRGVALYDIIIIRVRFKHTREKSPSIFLNSFRNPFRARGGSNIREKQMKKGRE